MRSYFYKFLIPKSTYKEGSFSGCTNILSLLDHPDHPDLPGLPDLPQSRIDFRPEFRLEKQLNWADDSDGGKQHTSQY